MTYIIALVMLVACWSAPLPAGESLFRGLVKNDHLGKAHDLEQEIRQRLVILFNLQARVDAKAWDDGVSGNLPKERPLVRVLDGGAIDAADRPRLIERLTKALDGTGVVFVLDWDGAVRKRLMGTEPIIVVGCDADGVECGRISGAPSAANRSTALGFLHIVPALPLTDRVLANPKTDPKPKP